VILTKDKRKVKMVALPVKFGPNRLMTGSLGEQVKIFNTKNVLLFRINLIIQTIPQVGTNII
jgi:hypothetical protein